MKKGNDMRDIDDYTENYNVPNFEDYQIIYRRKKVLEIVHKYAPKKILEIGCGMEPLFQYIDEDYKSYYIVEPSSIFYDNAVRLAQGKNVVCIHDFFPTEKGLQDAEFDFILCSGLLHELEQPEKLLEGIFKISNENTLVHINVPNAKSIHRLIAKGMGLITNEYELSDRNLLYQQHNVYDLKSLKASMEHAGLEVVECGSYFIKPFSHGQMYGLVKEKIINEDVLDGLYNIVQYMPEYGSEIFANCRLGNNINGAGRKGN